MLGHAIPAAFITVCSRFIYSGIILQDGVPLAEPNEERSVHHAMNLVVSRLAHVDDRYVWKFARAVCV